MLAKRQQSHVVFKKLFSLGKENLVLGADPTTTNETHLKQKKNDWWIY